MDESIPTLDKVRELGQFCFVFFLLSISTVQISRLPKKKKKKTKQKKNIKSLFIILYIRVGGAVSCLCVSVGVCLMLSIFFLDNQVFL